MEDVIVKPVPVTAVNNTVYAGFWIRVGAQLIDGLILGSCYCVLMVIYYILFANSITSNDEAVADAAAYKVTMINLAVTFIGNGIYYFGFNSSKYMGTPGKMAVGIAIVNTNGTRISLLKAIGRGFAKLLSAYSLLIGYFMIGWTTQKTGLHDLICSTRVVYRTSLPK